MSHDDLNQPAALIPVAKTKLIRINGVYVRGGAVLVHLYDSAPVRGLVVQIEVLAQINERVHVGQQVRAAEAWA